MNDTQELLFLFTGLCGYLENKGILNREEFAKYLLGMLEDERTNLADEQKEALKQPVNILLPLRLVK